MPTTLHFGARDWARCRFVRSLLWETTSAARTLVVPEHQPYQRAWLDTVDRDEAHRRLPVLLALNAHPGWVPDFLTPPAQSRPRRLETELAAVARTPLDQVAAELRRSLRSHPSRARHALLDDLSAHPTRARRAIITELRYAWTELLEPFWAPVRELIEADLAYRAEQVARLGFAATIADLHPKLSVTDDTVVLARGTDGPIELAGRGLALMPSAFVWPAAAVVYEGGWLPTLVYPARGIGELWTRRRPTPAGLAGVLGHTRALLLDDLDRPVTTTTLAVRNGLSMAATSAQLHRLHAAGLVSGQRVGKEVRYRRTPLGDSLLRANR